MNTTMLQPIRLRSALVGLALPTLSFVTTLAQSLPENTFLRIESGSIVTDSAGTQGFGWADCYGDGDLDLLVANTDTSAMPQVRCSVYRNQGDGTFATVADSLPGTKPGSYGDAVWADYDNDGDVDVFVPNLDNEDNDLFRNEGGGQFTDVSGPPDAPTADGGDSWAAAWIDIDLDGHLDLFVVNRGFDFSWQTGQDDCLYRNNGDGTYTKLNVAEVGDLVADNAASEVFTVLDFDNDGCLDIVRPRIAPGPIARVSLFKGSRGEAFSSVDGGSLTSEPAYHMCSGDYDNDGFSDLFGSGAFSPHLLHRNLGGQGFVDVSLDAGIDRVDHLAKSCWGDLDNDGDLDLFVQNAGETNTLYLNAGNGTFQSVDIGSALRDGDRDAGPAWVDYNNDGFLDLFLAYGDAEPRANAMYRNSLPDLGNSNRWLKVKLVGTMSNRSGVGAKVRARTTIEGREVRQLREIASTGVRSGGHQGLLAHFGLGDATKVDTLRIEWPSGIVQELKNVAPNQILTVTEPARLIPQAAGGFQIQCWINQAFDVQASTNLWNWDSIATVTNTSGILVFDDPEVDQHDCRYYRVVAE